MDLSRRSVVAGAALLSAAPAQAQKPRGKPFRVAHLTDLHVSPDPVSIRGVERAFASAQGYDPDLVLFGGDCILDGVDADYGWAVKQWDVFAKLSRSALSVPSEACLGNHDLWGGLGPSRSARFEISGKNMPLDRLGLAKAYRSFDRGGWHFVILDSIHIAGGSYTARLDETQYDWLVRDLAAVPASRPILVMTHVPILSACSLFDGPNERPNGWQVPGSLLHTDARRLKDLFRKHAVKLCLSGHIHLADVVRYCGVTYACGGAVCGGWWKGPYQEFGNGYGIVDLYPDGRFDYGYHEFAVS